jgi:hypothetical protein
MSYHEPQPSVFDDDIGDRDSLSSSDDENNDTNFAPSDKAPSLKPPSVYQTPQARSVASSIANAAREKLVQVSPNGRRCIVTNEEAPLVTIEAAHLLPRATRHELVGHLLSSLHVLCILLT